MLPRKNRISRDLINEVVRNGTPYFSQNLTLKCLPQQTKYTLFSFIVSSKVGKKAVDRNKLKRRVRYITQKIADKKKNLACVIILKPSSKNINFSELESEMSYLFKKANIIND